MEDRSLRPLLLLEVNEVPWRVIDHFREHPSLPALRQFFRNSMDFTTHIESSEELSPWVTWPTLHRGLTPEEHGIRFLGQDPNSFRGTSIWEEFTSRGHAVAVCGSLQSWPAMNPGNGGFHLPDTFAADAACSPPALNAFQRLNLRLTGENGRTRDVKGLPISDTASFLASWPSTGIRISTLLEVAMQLVREKFSPAISARRPIFQATLTWDIFRSRYNPSNPPAFASFFTNHVASIMHRYWRDMFPHDFAPGEEQGEHHADTMLFAMKKLDAILADALSFQRKNPRIVLAFASSMGQAAKEWETFSGFSAIVRDPIKLAAAVLGREGKGWARNLAMVPQVALQIPDASERAELTAALETCRTRGGEPIFFLEANGDRLSITVRTPRPEDLAAGGFQAGGKLVKWQAAGIEVRSVEAGTGYHIPEGVLALRGSGLEARAGRPQLPLESVKALLLETSALIGASSPSS
jgi:hypothetical protein